MTLRGAGDIIHAMKAILIISFFYANGTIERTNPVMINDFQLCLDLGSDVLRRSFTLEQKKAGLINASFECEPEIARA